MFFADFIGPIVKRVMRSLGIREENSLETILDASKMDIPFEVDTDLGFGECFDSNLEGEWTNLSDGDTVKVVFDGVEYICSAARIEDDIKIGNIDGNPDGLPFLFNFLGNGERWDLQISVMSTDPTHRFTLYKVTETTTPISDKYLPGPVVIDLTQYKTTDGHSINDLLLSAVQTSIASGGTLAKISDFDADGALRKALTTDKQVVVTITATGDAGTITTRFCPVIAINDTAGRANCISGNAVLFVAVGSPYEIDYLISFPPTSNQVHIYIKAKPFA